MERGPQRTLHVHSPASPSRVIRPIQSCSAAASLALLPLPMLELDPAGGLIYANPAAARLWDRAAQTLTGKTLDDLFQPCASTTPFFEHWAGAGLESGAGAAGEVRLRNPGQAGVFWLEARPRFDQAGRLLSVVASLHQQPDRTPASPRPGGAPQDLDLFLEGVEDLVYSLSLEGALTRVNQAAEILTGHSRADLLARPSLWRELLHPEDREVVDWFFAKHPRGVAYYDQEFRLKTAEGDWAWIAARMVGIKEPAGGFAGYHCLGRDITGLKLAEERYRGLFEKLSDAALVVDQETGIILNANQRTEVMLAAPRHQIVGMDCRGMFPRHRGEAVHREICRLIAAGGRVELESEVLRGDGRTCPVTISATLVPLGGRQHLLEVFRDDSERRAAAQALGASERRYRELYLSSLRREQLYESLLNGTPDAVVIYDLSSRATYVNPAFERIFGYSLEALRAQAPEFVPPAEQAADQETKRNVLAGQPVQGLETRRRTADGRLLEVAMSASRYQDHRGEPAGIVVFLRDITQTNRLERELRHAQKMEAVGTLASGIAHDFNNILQSIGGFTQLMLREESLSARHRRYLDQVDHAGRQAAELIKGLLTFSRRVTPELKPLAVNQVVRQSVKMLERFIPKMIEIRTDLDPGLWPVMGDEIQVEQVLINLGTNAKDAMPQGGKLSFLTRNRRLEREDCLGLPGLAPGFYVELTVRDSGQGIPPELIPHIFEPFFTTKGVGQGTGLGLSTVYGAVKSHGGHVSCHSSPGQGAVFVVHLPAVPGRPDADQAPAGPAPDPARPGRGQGILLVDDDPAILTVNRELLEDSGFQVFTARSGEEALTHFTARPASIKLVVLDLGMPGMGGHECLERLRKLDPGLPVIVATGYAQNCEKGGPSLGPVAALLTKPYRLNRLLETIVDLLDGAPAENN
ncbi:MAG: PAS domain S-box protein [Deltaproteobacteria bacterium]|nr:PAS domain S-box protein [Deltaproteobacteria bacterium]